MYAPVQELTKVHVALPAPLVCHEQAAGLGEHEGMDGAHVVHGSQASRLLRGHLLYLVQLARLHQPG